MLPQVKSTHLAEDPMEANFSLPSHPARATITGRGILILVAATLLVPLAAHLSPTRNVTGPVRQSVAYAYVDVTSDTRVPTLYRRFQREALQFCGRLEIAGAIAPGSRMDCAVRVVESAVRRVDAPVLTAYHDAQQVSTQVTRVASAR
jgi:UrcA family protein